MAGFRKKSFPIRIYPPVDVTEEQLQTFEEEVEGNVVTRVAKVPVNLSSKEAAASIPTYKEYYLEELQKAGVPLDQINVFGMFNPTDQVTLENARKSALARIESKIKASQVTPTVESTVESVKTEE